MFAFKIDEQKKLVLVEVTGIMSVSDADKLGEALLANASAARRKFGRLRLLIDARLSPVQPADTVRAFKSPRDVLQGDNDRYAVVVGSSLSMLQANRILGPDGARAFSSMDDAESWLLAWAPSGDSEHGSSTE